MRSGRPSDDITEAAEALYGSLLSAAKKISQLEHPGEQMRNIGQGLMHHMSFTMLISKSLKLLVKAKVYKKGMLRMGKTGEAYRVNLLNQPLRQRLASWVRFDQQLLQCKAPRNCAEWLAESERVQVIMQKTCGLHQEKGYRGMWVIRAYLLYAMRRDGIDRLTVEEGVTVKTFLNMFPDQKKDMEKMAGGKSKTYRSVQDIFDECQCPSIL